MNTLISIACIFYIIDGVFKFKDKYKAYTSHKKIVAQLIELKKEQENLIREDEAKRLEEEKAAKKKQTKKTK